MLFKGATPIPHHLHTTSINDYHLRDGFCALRKELGLVFILLGGIELAVITVRRSFERMSCSSALEFIYIYVVHLLNVP